MAILEQGQLGLFNGKIGALVISKWKNSYVGRGKPKKSTKAPTAGQLDTRSKFALVGKFITRFPKIIAAGYGETKKTTAMNEAIRYNLEHAVSGIYPNYLLDLPNIMLSKVQVGTWIDAGLDPVMTALPKRGLQLTWKLEDVPGGDTKPTDILYTLYYHPQSQLSMSAPGKIVRSKLTVDTSMPRIFQGEVHGWMFFSSEDGKQASITQYLGKVTIV
ncbi:DUF6266 family protein [Pedobacter cryoconitis]|uniref:Uncharacterized protein n=1 Tax=Pedobacter cryoconitis TaxID=188932 RepID=A0A7X0ML23_9SPHI|nr:DUF6266 family protein [Pedobacter cryoconitis]MBB6502804.1 hypothetical protein [Pedobacter cryoconitis]